MRVLETPWPHIALDAVTSTQDEVRARLVGKGKERLTPPFWVSAKEQMEGRGRRGRVWVSKRGNFYASLALPLPANQADAPKFGFICVLALFDALSALGVDGLSIKWPNDLLLGEEKIAGILLEREGDWLILGMGVNLTHAPQTQDIGGAGPRARALGAASLADYAIAPARLQAQIETRLRARLSEFEKKGFAAIRQALTMRLWLRREYLYSNDMHAREATSHELVRLRGIGEDGALIILGEKGERRIYAGDLWPIG